LVCRPFKESVAPEAAIPEKKSLKKPRLAVSLEELSAREGWSSVAKEEKEQIGVE